MITGNHDKDYTRDHIFQSVQDYKELKTEYGKFILFHKRDWTDELMKLMQIRCPLL